MVPNLVSDLVSDFASDFASDLAPDGEVDAGVCCGAGGELCVQLAAWDNSNRRAETNRRALRNRKVLSPREGAELRCSAGTGEGARPHTSRPSRNSGRLTMEHFGFDESPNGTRCSQKES